MAACVDRLRRCFERTIADLELDALGELLGRRPETVAEGVSAVDAGIEAHRFDDETVLGYLAGHCRRLEWLYAPACALYPGRDWAALE